jgi:hypothetical protein
MALPNWSVGIDVAAVSDPQAADLLRDPLSLTHQAAQDTVKPWVAAALADSDVSDIVTDAAEIAVSAEVVEKDLVGGSDPRTQRRIFTFSGAAFDSNRRADESATRKGRRLQSSLNAELRRTDLHFLNQGVPKTVGAGMDYATPTAAGDDFATKKGNWWWDAITRAGEYAANEYHQPARMRLRGQPGATRVTSAGGVDQPDTVVNILSTWWMTRSSEMLDMIVDRAMGRYAVHADEGGTNVNITIRTRRCTFRHYGNQAAIDWRTANPGSGLNPATVWKDPPAWGMGTASGQRIDHVDDTFISEGHSYAYHNNGKFTDPSIVTHKRSRFVNRGGSQGILLASLGSGTPDRFELTDCSISGGYILRHDDGDGTGLWRGGAPYYSDHYEIETVITGGDPMAFRPMFLSRALRITSTGVGATSTVALSGTAADLFGSFIARKGGGGLKGYAYSAYDVSGMTVQSQNADKSWSTVTGPNTLGRRLGVLATAKTLTVTTEAGAVTHTFAAGDYTAQSNPTILAAINASLGGAATADLYDVSGGEHYIQQPDRELTLRNTGTVGIPRFSAVQFDGSPRAVKLVGLTDAAATFIGVTLEAIPPGGYGRVLASGVMLGNQTAAAADLSPVPFNTPIYLSDTVAGGLSKAGTRQVGYGCDAGANLFHFEALRSI